MKEVRKVTVEKCGIEGRVHLKKILGVNGKNYAPRKALNIPSAGRWNIKFHEEPNISQMYALPCEGNFKKVCVVGVSKEEEKVKSIGEDYECGKLGRIQGGTGW